MILHKKILEWQAAHPKHNMDWMGYCLGDCSGAAVLAFKNFEVTSLRPPGSVIGSKER